MNGLPDYPVDILDENNMGKTSRQMSPGSFLFYLKDINNGSPLAILEGLLPMLSEMITPGEPFYAQNFNRGRGHFPEC